MRQITQRLGISYGTAVGLFFCVHVHAATLNMADSPLYLATDTPANVFFQIDDSGSMDWDILTVQYHYYTSYWHSGNHELVTHGRWRAYSSSGSCSGRINYVYFFDNSDDAYNSCSYPTAEQNTETFVRDWRVRSSDFNVMYYDPSKTYSPWPGYPNATFTAVRSDPQLGTSGYTVTRNLTGFIYEQWTDTRGYSGSNPNGPATATSGANGWVDLWDDHKTTVVNATTLSQTSYSFPITSTATECDLAAAQQTPHYSSCYQTTSSTTTLAATDTDEYGRTPAEIQQNIANWYQYYRRRSFVAKAAVGQVVSNSPNYRYGLSVINDNYSSYSGIFVEVPTGTDYTTHNSNLLDTFYSYNWPAKGTPLRHGLERTGKYFDNTISGKTDPIISSCQHNFSILMTDGYWNGSAPGTSGIGDNDGDGHHDTVADVAKYFYDTDLSTLANDVPTSTFDTQDQQHMVTFTVAFGVEGNLTDSDNDGWPDSGGTPLIESSNWGDPFTSTPAKIDDLWHAAYNSRGEFISAKSPSLLIQALQSAIAAITNRVSSASAVALSSGSWNTDTHIFQAKFDPGNWSGQLLAYPVSSTGAIGNSVWEAGAKLDSQNYDTGRIILTYDTADDKGVAFRFPANYKAPGVNDISASQIEFLLRDAPYAYNTTDSSEINANQIYGDKLLDYLRGDDTNEGSQFRARAATGGKLGDIIHSDPIYVGPPSRRFTFTGYQSFVTNNVNRKPVLYVGANDGMMHGFDADPGSSTFGQELIAYVPGSLYEKLPDLASLNYSHQYYVDGTINFSDAWLDSKAAWRTVLIGGLRGGGQGIYALDITDPSSFSESSTNAEAISLWEFTDADDNDLGNTFGIAPIAKFKDGNWYVVLGNGYNNTASDGNVGDGKAYLYLLDVDDGTVFKKFATEAGSTSDPNGLSTPAPVDIDGDNIIDYIYAGDLYGNLWKFDVTATNTNQWGPIKQGNSPAPLYSDQYEDTSTNPSTFTRQPITTRPEVAYHPSESGLMVYFGTGKYFETGDNSASSQGVQSLYGIWDKQDNNAIEIERAQLKPQIIKEEVEVNNTWYRLVTGVAINWHTGNGLPNVNNATTQVGWYMDLIDPDTAYHEGERVVSQAFLRNDRIIFTTLIPSTASCEFGGDGWIMELAYGNGGRLEESPFDVDKDGDFDDDDKITPDSSTQFDDDEDGQTDANAPMPAGGTKPGDGIPTTPGVLATEDEEVKYISTSSGTIETFDENAGDNDSGRQSWRQLD